MTSGSSASISRRERTLLAAVSLAPFLVYLLARVLGYTKLLNLAGAAGVALAGATAIFLRPRWGLWLLLFYVYAGLGFYFPMNPAGLVTLLVLAAVVLNLIRGDDNRLDDPWFWYANALFLLISLGSMVFARDPVLSFKELSSYAKMVLVTYLVVQLVRTPDDLKRLMFVVFAGAVAGVLFGVMNLAFGIQPMGQNYIGGGANLLRFAGTHENPNRAAAIMCTALPLGLFALKYSSRVLRVAIVAGIITLIVAMFATFSRSVVIPFAIIIAAVVIRELRSRRSYVALVALLAFAIVLTPRFYWERVFGLREALTTTTLDWSVYTRLLALRTAWEMFLDHPLTGIGIGNFLTAAAYQLFVRIVVHNSYLEILVGTGVFGLLAFLLILLSGVRHTLTGARRRWKRHPEWMRSASFYFMLSSLSIYLSAFFGTMPFRYPLWIPVAAGLVIGNLLREDRAEPQGVHSH